MRKRYVLKGYEHVVDGPMHAVQRYKSLHKSPPPDDKEVNASGIKIWRNIGGGAEALKIRIRKIKKEKGVKKNVKTPRSPDHVTVIVPTTVRLKTTMGSIAFRRKWCGTIPQDPKWCAVIWRGMLKGMYQIMQIGDDEITCNDRPMRPFKPTHMRIMPRNPKTLVRR